MVTILEKVQLSKGTFVAVFLAVILVSGVVSAGVSTMLAAGPQGPQGEKGDTGPQGDTGPT